MKPLLLSLLLTSCAPFAMIRPDSSLIVSGGFLSKVGGSAIKVVAPNGAQLTLVTKSFNGTEVANGAIAAYGTATGAGKFTK